MPKSKLSNVPWDIHVTNNTSSSLNVTWQPPLNTDNAVAHYLICYRTSKSQKCRTQLVEGHARSAILENLNASTEYFIRVRAVTCKGPGNYSEEISHKTRGKKKTHLIIFRPEFVINFSLCRLTIISCTIELS